MRQKEIVPSLPKKMVKSSVVINRVNPFVDEASYEPTFSSYLLYIHHNHVA